MKKIQSGALPEDATPGYATINIVHGVDRWNDPILKDLNSLFDIDDVRINETSSM